METQNKIRSRATQKMETLKNFYQHLIIFIIVNTATILWNANIFNESPINFNEFGTYFVAVFWGIGLFWHFIYVVVCFYFRNNWLQKWEERKIREMIEKEEM